MALAVAIFQDLFIIIFFLFLPLLLPQTGDAGAFLPRLGSLGLRGGIFVVLAGVGARWVIPWLLNAVSQTRNRELFTLTVIGSCVGLAFVGGLLGLGLALGAFVAGLAVSESIFKHRILADVMPLKDLFLTLFFVSVGLMIDVKTTVKVEVLPLGGILERSRLAEAEAAKAARATPPAEEPVEVEAAVVAEPEAPAEPTENTEAAVVEPTDDTEKEA